MNGYVLSTKLTYCYIFALNIDMKGANDAPKRISLTKDCLFALGLLKDL